MKIRLLVCTLILFSSYQLSAYIYSFSNHTNDPLKVRVQLAGINEPWEEVYIPAKEMRDFPWTALGHSRASLNIWKAGFCLQNIQSSQPLKEQKRNVTKDGEDLGYTEEYMRDAQGNIKFGPWANVVVEYIQNEGANAILRAAEAFADSLQDLAKDVASAVAQ